MGVGAPGGSDGGGGFKSGSGSEGGVGEVDMSVGGDGGPWVAAGASWLPGSADGETAGKPFTTSGGNDAPLGIDDAGSTGLLVNCS